MKKILLSSLVLMMGAVVFGQTSNRSELKPAPQNVLLTKSHESSLKNMNAQKTLACIDTIRYSQTKEQVLGTDNFFIFELWANDNESMSQTFLLNGATLGITGVEFFGRNSPNGIASVSVRASIYNVDGNNNPITEIAFANITISDTNFSYRQVNFTPINVTGNYAVVIRPTNAGGIVDFYVNDAAPSQSYDENLSRAKSDWYTSSNGNWVNMPTYTVSGFTGGPFDFEMLAAPKITYTINTDFTASPTPSCLGTPVTFTNTTTPTTILNSRFYNFQEFRNFFQTIPDSTYAYAMGGATPLIWSENTTFTYATAANHTPILYTLGGFWNSCLDNNTKTVSVNPLPTVTANATSTSVCAGTQVTLTGGGATSYTWNNGVTNGVAFTPTATTTYTVTGTDGNNCQNTAQVTVTVNPLPTVTANASATTVCAGGQVTLTGSGATSYTWDNGVTDGVAFTPTATTTYNVTGTTGSCSDVDQITITVNPTPTVTANATATSVCAGTQVTLTGGGATSYTWDNGVTNGVAFTPTATTTYTVTGTNANNCQNTAQVTVTVNPLPTVTANATATTICAGGQVTLTGGGATSYTWDNGVTDGVAFSPTTTTTYTVTGIDGNNCQNTAQVTVTVATGITVTANATATSICAGDQVTLTGGGATSYSWDNGVTNGVAFTPTASTTYTVTGTSGSCTDNDQITITVNPLPTVTANASASSICNGDPVTLTGGGATSYSWDNGVTDGVAFNPTANTTYTVTGTDANNCQNTATTTVTVTTVDATTTTTGTSIAANNNNATYQWVDCDNSNQPITGATSQSFTPTATGNYAVVVTENGCSETSACENIIITGINEVNANNNISLYPNPVRDVFTISSSNDLSGTVVKIVAITGQTLVEKTIISVNTATFDMSVYATGLYFVEINQNGNLNTLKVIKK
ncbi:MAG: T9SS type A sorting domain-containing protein [Vicingaceae bacterium]|nr:T9SS type A sorting domain-containing protein [Vicingaceae bacterium]